MPLRRYLMIAGAFHIMLTVTIFLIGHFRVLPNQFDENGIGLTFAVDGTSYQPLATRLADELQSNGVAAWLNIKAPFHTRLHSLTFATFGKLLGHNILAAEPLNLFYYLSILICIYFLGRESFDAQTGFFAAAIVGLWPSFLLHSTQLMRDPLSIACLLALTLVLTLLLSRQITWLTGLGLGIAGAILVTLFWVSRGNMWNVVLVAVALTLGMLLVRMFRADKFMIGNALVMVLIIMAVLLVPPRLESATLQGQKPPLTPLAIPTAAQPPVRELPEGRWTRVIRQIANRRAGFRLYNSHASDIDPEVQFNGAGDILRFVPRALVIGFFAPFPKMWLQTGTFGFAPRLLSGLETLAMYFLYLAVGLGVWRERRNMKMWLLFLVATTGLLALGLVVVNAGALFRIRYVFWMMLIVIAAKGVVGQDYRIFKINKISIMSILKTL
jgi:4-amino-4-deoxy-L-arabinose transferase-like glycosyltransferase